MNRRARSLTLNAIVIAVVLGLLVAANILVSKTPQAWDLTRAGNNTLAPQSVLAAKGLTSDLQVIGLFRPSTNSGQNETEALVALYAAQSSHVRYRSANADQDAVAAVGDRERVIASADCGFGTFTRREWVIEPGVWLKLKSLREGADIASARLWS